MKEEKKKKMDNLNTRAQMVPLLSVGDFFLAEQVPVKSTTTAGRV